MGFHGYPYTRAPLRRTVEPTCSLADTALGMSRLRKVLADKTLGRRRPCFSKASETHQPAPPYSSSISSASNSQPSQDQKYVEMSQSGVGEISNSFNNNNNCFNTVSHFGSIDERAEILAWLSPLEPRIRHDDIKAQRVEDVGDWLFQTEEYRDWLDGIHGGEPDNSALFCYGDPGVGKTYIT